MKQKHIIRLIFLKFTWKEQMKTLKYFKVAVDPSNWNLGSGSKLCFFGSASIKMYNLCFLLSSLLPNLVLCWCVNNFPPYFWTRFLCAVTKCNGLLCDWELFPNSLCIFIEQLLMRVKLSPINKTTNNCTVVFILFYWHFLFLRCCKCLCIYK